MLGIALNEATRLGLLAANPVSRTTSPTHTPKEGTAWTVEDARRFLAVARNDSYAPYWELALFLGMRPSEITGATLVKRQSGPRHPGGRSGAPLRWGQDLRGRDHQEPERPAHAELTAPADCSAVGSQRRTAPASPHCARWVGTRLYEHSRNAMRSKGSAATFPPTLPASRGARNHAVLHPPYGYQPDVTFWGRYSRPCPQSLGHSDPTLTLKVYPAHAGRSAGQGTRPPGQQSGRRFEPMQAAQR